MQRQGQREIETNKQRQTDRPKERGEETEMGRQRGRGRDNGRANSPEERCNARSVGVCACTYSIQFCA